MQSSLTQSVTFSVDTLLSLAVFAAFLRPTLRKSYPWIFAYACVRAAAALAIGAVRYGSFFNTPLTGEKVYFVTYWTCCLTSAVLLFLGCLDVYKQAMAPLQGLTRMGTTIFRWAALASLLVTATTLTSIDFGPGMLMKIGVQLMRCAGTAELCLLALLLLSLNAIGLSVRSRPFGIALGLGVMAAVDCVQSLIAGLPISTSPILQTVFESVTFVSLGLWVAYAALPEPARKTVTVRADSAIYKWDQIASALGHKGTQVALQPAPSFFLVDVEKVVERAFVRTLKRKESET